MSQEYDQAEENDISLVKSEVKCCMSYEYKQ